MLAVVLVEGAPRDAPARSRLLHVAEGCHATRMTSFRFILVTPSHARRAEMANGVHGVSGPIAAGPAVAERGSVPAVSCRMPMIAANLLKAIFKKSMLALLNLVRSLWIV